MIDGVVGGRQIRYRVARSVSAGDYRVGGVELDKEEVVSIKLQK